MKIQLIILICSVNLLFSCISNNEEGNDKNTLELTDKKEHFNKLDSTEEETTDTKEIDSLIKIWNWDEKIQEPSKSSITNPKYSPDLLYGKWCFPEDTKPIFIFNKDFFDETYQKYIYTINYDSLRIFTHYDHPGDGFERGIITKLTEDSLIIIWSTGDTSMYISQTTHNPN